MADTSKANDLIPYGHQGSEPSRIRDVVVKNGRAGGPQAGANGPKAQTSGRIVPPQGGSGTAPPQNKK